MKKRKTIEDKTSKKIKIIKKPKEKSIEKKDRLSTSIKKCIVIKELVNNFGLITQACKKANISRKQYYDWMNDDIDFYNKINELYDKIEDIKLDFVENIAFEMMGEKNPQIVLHYLKTKGKKRGYSEKIEQDITIKDSNIVFELKMNNENDNNKEFGTT